MRSSSLDLPSHELVLYDFSGLLDPVNVFVYEVPQSIHMPNHDSDLP